MAQSGRHRPSETCGCDGCTAMRLRIDGDWAGLADHLRRTQAAQLASRHGAAATIDDVLFETRRHFGGCSARVAVALSTAIARDLAGLGPYDQALLKRQDVTREAEYEHQGAEPPNPYDLALARRGETR